MNRPNRPTSPKVNLLRTRSILTGSVLALIAAGTTANAQLTLSGTSYTQNFDTIGTGLPSGWTGRTGATSTALGTAASLTTTATSWADSGGSFKNVASATGLTSAESAANQALATDRALGIRQSGSFGDPGAAFTLQLANTLGFQNFTFSLALEMLSVQTRSTTWTVQYGVGASPTSFTSLFTYSDPGAFGITTTGTLTLGSDANNSSGPVWIRVVALAASVNSNSRDTFGIDDFNLNWENLVAVTPLFWDTNGSTAGTGGSGTWDTTTSNWSTAAAGDVAPTVYTNASPITFGGTAGDVTITAGGVTSSGGITIETAGYDIKSGGSLTLSNALITTSHAAGTVSTISATVAGTAGLTKSGTGTLALSGTNTFTGNVNVGGGRLRIAADGNLGDVANDIQLASGGLEVTTDLSLPATRDLTGAGTLDIADTKTLTVAGVANTTSTTLSNSGTLALNGATRTVGDVTFTTGGTLTGNAPITAGNITYSGTGAGARVTADLALGSTSRTITVADGADNADLTLTGTLVGTGRLNKLGPGTLRLEGDSSGAGKLTSSMRIGTAGTTTAAGGRVVITNKGALGGSSNTIQLQFNDGILQSTADLIGVDAIPLGLSIGAGQGTPATFAGSPMEFTGASVVFKAGDNTTTYDAKVTVDTDVTISGTLGAAGGNGVVSKLMVNGTGSLTLANASNAHNLPIQVDEATLRVNGALTSSAATITINDIATLEGSGSIAGNTTVTFGGKLAPGNLGAGTLTFGGNLDISGAAGVAGQPSFTFELGSTSDKVDLTTGILSFGLSVLDFSDFSFVELSGFGPGTYPLFETTQLLDGILGETLTGSIGAYEGTIAFADGGTDLVLNVVPEPGSAVLLLGGLAILGARRRSRK